MSKRKQKLTRRQIRLRRQRRIQTGVITLSALCLAGIGLMAFMNRLPASARYTYTTEDDIWYVGDSSLEIAAPEMEAPPDALTKAPAPTATSTPVPTDVPVPTEGPTPVPEDEPVTITITATGDVTLGVYKTSGGYSNFKSYVEKYGYEYFLENYRDLFSQDDLTIVNLEGPLTDSKSKRPGRTFNFRGDPEYVKILTCSSVEICNMANNHALDYQQEGFEDTYQTLANAGIGASGYGPEYYTEVNGVTVGSVGFTEWNFEEKDILKAVSEAAQKCDLLIVSMHWGKEGYGEFSKYAASMGRKLVDAGADLVIGNHPHVAGAIAKYNGKYIINALGNFCFGGNDKQNPKVRKCAVFRQKFVIRPNGDVEDGGIDIVPGFTSGEAKYNDFRPTIAGAEDGAEILNLILFEHSKKTLDLDEVVWLDDSYVYKYGVIERPNQPSAGGEGIESAQDAIV